MFKKLLMQSMEKYAIINILSKESHLLTLKVLSWSATAWHNAWLTTSSTSLQTAKEPSHPGLNLNSLIYQWLQIEVCVLWDKQQRSLAERAIGYILILYSVKHQRPQGGMSEWDGDRLLLSLFHFSLSSTLLYLSIHDFALLRRHRFCHNLALH